MAPIHAESTDSAALPGRTEEALRATERRGRALGRSIDFGVWTCDAEGRNTYCSEELRRVTGLSAEQCAGDGWRQALHPDEVERALARWQVSVQTGRPWSFEHLLRGADGRWHPVLSRAVPLKDEGGRIAGWVGVSHDLGALRGAEEERAHLERAHQERTAELEAANQTLQMMSSCRQHLVRSADERLLLQSVCRVIHEEGGYRFVWVGRAEGDARLVPVATSGDAPARLRGTLADPGRGGAAAQACLRTGKASVRRGFADDPALRRWRAEAKRWGYGACIALPLRSEGRILGVLTVYAGAPTTLADAQIALLTELADDLALGVVSLRTRAERDHAQRIAERRAGQLRVLASELTLAEQKERQRLSEFLHDELQQLLVGAKFRVGALEHGSGRDPKKLLSELGELITESIECSRTLAHELSPPVLRRAGLVPALQWLAGWFEKRHRLKVRFEAPAELAAMGEERAILLYQATRELLFNVVKHARVRSARLGVRREGDLLRISVVDRGRGFDPRQLQAAGGAFGGLGLFGIHERLELFGGRLEVESRPGRGSRFCLVLPLLQPAAVPEPPEPVARAPRRARGRRRGAPAGTARARVRVLLVDDHVVMRQGLAELLRAQPDLEVVGEASGGEAAVALARQVRPDVVIMDVNMPGMGGVEATRAIGRELPDVRVIGLSLFAREEQAAAMREAGAVGYCSKSDAPASLVAAIRSGR